MNTFSNTPRGSLPTNICIRKDKVKKLFCTVYLALHMPHTLFQKTNKFKY